MSDFRHLNSNLDLDHEADPYDHLLRAGICRRCGKPSTAGCSHMWTATSPESGAVTELDFCAWCGVEK